MTPQRAHVRVQFEGRVQGIGFRATARQIAKGFMVCGWVRNMADGRVELEAEGERTELEEFLADLQKSEVGGFIKRADVQWSEGQGQFKGFEIRL